MHSSVWYSSDTVRFVSLTVRYASCTVRLVSLTVRYASCMVRFVSWTVRYASCTVRFVSWTVRYAYSTVRFVSFTALFVSSTVRTLRERYVSLSARNGSLFYCTIYLRRLQGQLSALPNLTNSPKIYHIIKDFNLNIKTIFKLTSFQNLLQLRILYIKSK